MILDPKTPCFLSTSILSLLAEIKAISIPEKKAENINDKRIIITTFISRVLFPLFSSHGSTHVKHSKACECNKKEQPAFLQSLHVSLVDSCDQGKDSHNEPEYLKDMV